MNQSERTATDDRVVVVGSGPCGAMAAARLVQRGVRVTMLDAGLRQPRGIIVRGAGNTLFRVKEGRLLERERHRRNAAVPVEWSSSRSLGGLSNYWTAAVPRFAPRDFDEGAVLDERYRWPITYDDLEPYYHDVERFLTITAGAPFPNVPANDLSWRTTVPHDWADVAAAAREHGHFIGPIPMAKGAPWMVALRGTEFSSYACVIESLLSSPLFELVRGATVTGLTWNSTIGAVDAVESVDSTSGERTSRPCRAVVVAAGAMDSTLLLLRSKSDDFPTGLGNTNGVIGRYLHDHPKEWWTATVSRPMSALAHPLYISRADYDEASPLMATALTIGLAAPVDRLRTYVRGRSNTLGVQAFGTMVPLDEVGVSIPADVGPGEADCTPTISLTYDQQTIDNVISSRQRLIDVCGEAGLRVTVPGPFHQIVPGSSVHYGGTVRMHESAEFGALDGWNRLRDVGNVAVCDSSCFTTGPEKNPTLTAMAIATRAADGLADEITGVAGGRPAT